MKPTPEDMVRFIVAARVSQRIRDRDGWANPTQCGVIVALADQLDEALALVQELLNEDWLVGTPMAEKAQALMTKIAAAYGATS